MEQLRVLLAIQGGSTSRTALSHAAVQEDRADETSHQSSDFCTGDLPAFGGSAFLLSHGSLPLISAARAAGAGMAVYSGLINSLKNGFCRCHSHCEERNALLALKGVGPTVVSRLEQMGIESLPELAQSKVGEILSQASAALGSTC